MENAYICIMEKDKKETILSETGKFLVDISKLIFGGVILAGIMKNENINPFYLFDIGTLTVLICFIAGLLLTTFSKK